MSNFGWIQDWLTDEERARLFKYNSPEVLESAMKAQGTDVLCDDPATLRATAEIVIRAREKGTVEPSLSRLPRTACMPRTRSFPETSRRLARLPR